MFMTHGATTSALQEQVINGTESAGSRDEEKRERCWRRKPFWNLRSKRERILSTPTHGIDGDQSAGCQAIEYVGDKIARPDLRAYSNIDLFLTTGLSRSHPLQ
jgi:hypothetical protein